MYNLPVFINSGVLGCCGSDIDAQKYRSACGNPVNLNVVGPGKVCLFYFQFCSQRNRIGIIFFLHQQLIYVCAVF